MLRRTLVAVCAVMLAPAVMPSTAAAQPLDKRTYFTFSGPVSIPGVTLPPGEYVFRLANPNGGRKVIQVLKADGTEPLGMFFSLPSERAQVAEEPEVRFMETAAGMPTAVRTWWYPGESTGYEFIYPKEQARRLAQGTADPVLTTAAQTRTAAETDTDDLSRIGADGRETAVNSGSSAARMPSGNAQRGTLASAGQPRDDNRAAVGNAAGTTGNEASNRTAANRSDTAVNRPGNDAARQPVGTSGSASPANAGSAANQASSARSELPATATIAPSLVTFGLIAFAAALALWTLRSRRLTFDAWRR